MQEGMTIVIGWGSSNVVKSTTRKYLFDVACFAVHKNPGAASTRDIHACP